MSKKRTTLRIDEDLKKQAERLAVDSDTTLQAVFNQALADYLNRLAQKRARKIAFKTHNLGENTDNLTRRDYYPEPTDYAEKS